jgi:hypothetical protein
MNGRDMYGNETKSITRTVLIEKAPFEVVLNDASGSSWWYHPYRDGAEFMVKEGRSKDLETIKINSLHKKLLLEHGFFIVIEEHYMNNCISKLHANRT